ncbi:MULTISPECIES: SDR family NAD(P)-dependent oxidoreductase [unclassified Pedobacter]|uniref:SDR family NAD(P)-dependent oxidoreductase n=1 Tax=Pedobacter TaxID=84567 RepID=UPI000B4B589B|nr:MULTISPECIES: SDR family oxidoreductase [unclassified Pedobacter]MCX2432973.1 SDR family NAD(P)-dependent oxidoreductase [Pedobacter sp. GR22-10]MCX2585961.1 SDR family NAD(P)-dependent oxidoreductase [Pedobacter sp. MR22-3]OWK72200.1 oxidoreductase [Pedobacter sp. AJM]
MRFQHQNILVIGGSSGIGLDLIRLLNNEGATIYAASRNRSAEWPAAVHYLEMDVMQGPESLSAFIPDELHGLVYCVGNINLKPFNRISALDLIDDFRLNVVGAALSIQQALKSLKNVSSASIVLMSSVAARTGMGFHSSIASSKAAVEGLTISLAAELSPNHIRVNAVAPSLTHTPLAGKLLNTPEKMEASAKRHPIGRFGEPKDISAAIAYLLSSDSSWITGQILTVDGGIGNLKTNF